MFALRSSHLLELAVNVIQNGWTGEETYDHIAHSDRQVMVSFAECAMRQLLQEIYDEGLRQNLSAVRRAGASKMGARTDE